MDDKKAPTLSIGKRARQQAQALSREVERQESSNALIALDDVKPRARGDLFELKIENLVHLAGSLALAGQISPISVDRNLRLIVGRHRLYALRMLATAKRLRTKFLMSLVEQGARGYTAELVDAAKRLAHQPNLRVRAEIMLFDVEKEPLRAAEIEIQENTQRQSVTATEVRTVYDRLREIPGFADRRRPKKGEVALVGYLANLFGKSAKQIRRDLDAQKPKGNPAIKPLRNLLNARKRLLAEFVEEDEVQDLLLDPRWALFEEWLQGELESQEGE